MSGPEPEKREVGKDKSKKPRLFYWEDAEDCWCPVDGIDIIGNVIDIDNFISEGDEIEIKFKRFDMTDDEIDNLPEN